jgi:hypothetical protein
MMAHDPRVRQHLLRGEPRRGFDVQASQDEVARVLAQPVIKPVASATIIVIGSTIHKERARLDQLQRLVHRLSLVRRLAHEALVREDADGQTQLRSNFKRFQLIEARSPKGIAPTEILLA